MVLSVRDLCAGRDADTMLKMVDLDVGRHEIVALVGARGAGKTTLLEAVCGLRAVRGGTVRFMGRIIGGLAAERIVRRGLAYVPGDCGLFDGLTVRENLLLGAGRVRRPEPARVLELFPSLREQLDRTAALVSGADRRRCAIARALMAGPGLLMIDDVAHGLSPKESDEILQRLCDLAASGTAVLLAEQAVDRALAVADRAYLLDGGSVSAAGTSGSLLINPLIRATYLGVP